MVSSAPDNDVQPESTIPPRLREIRQSIDNIDAALIYLLSERFKFTQEVGRLKAERGMPATDALREEQQISRMRDLAIAAHLDPVFAEKFLNFVIAEVIQHHEDQAAQAQAEAE